MDKNDNEQNNRGQKKFHIFHGFAWDRNGGMGDSPSGAVAKTSPSKAGGVGLTPGGELRSHMPYCQKIKTWNRSNILKNSIKTFWKNGSW